MKKRNPIERETVNPVDILSAETVNQQDNKTVKQQNNKTVNQQDSVKAKDLIKYTTYLPEDLIIKIKITAAKKRKKGYEVIQEALRKFLDEETNIL